MRFIVPINTPIYLYRVKDDEPNAFKKVDTSVSIHTAFYTDVDVYASLSNGPNKPYVFFKLPKNSNMIDLIGVYKKHVIIQIDNNYSFMEIPR